MPRTTSILLAAGLAGAISAGFVSSAMSVPAAGASTEAADPQPNVGTVDVLLLLERMLDTEPYKSARDSTAKVWNDQIQPLATERDNLFRSLSEMEQDNPDAQALYQQYQGLDQRIRKLSADAQVAIDQTSAEQLADAYKKIHTAVHAIADEQGFDRVFASRMTVDTFNADNTNVVVQEVLLRPVLKNTPEHDLTDMVRLELGLPEAPAQPAEEEAGPTPEQPEPTPADDGGDR